MAVCAKCGVEIEEGKYLCESCENEEASQKQTEEYLDNLLDNIQEGSALELLQKRGKPKEKNPVKDLEEMENIPEDFATLLGESSLEGVMEEKMGEDKIKDDEVTDNEELDLSGLDGLDDIDFEAMDDLDDIDLDVLEGLGDIDFGNMEDISGEDTDTALMEEPSQDTMKEAEGGLEPEELDIGELGLDDLLSGEEVQGAAAKEAEAGLEPEDAGIMMEELGLGELLSEELSENEPEDAGAKEMAGEADEAGDMDDMLDQLLAELDDGGSVGVDEPEEAAVSDEDLGKMMEDYKGSDEELQDLDDLLALMEDEEGSDAAPAGGEEEMDSGEDNILESEEDFSEADLLDLEGFDDEETEDSLGFDEGMAAMTDEVAMEEDALADLLEEEIAIPVPEETPKKKKGLLAKVFGNVVDEDIAKQELAERKAEEEAEAKKAEEKKEKEESDAAKKAEKDELKAKKAAEKKEQKELAKKEKAEKKAEKLAKKQAAREEAEKEAELEVVGKLNKAGVGIVVAFGIAFLAFVTLGTQSFSYASAMKDAKEYYDNKKYTRAYEELLGIDVKEKDQEFYDKVITIMKVNRQIDSYSTYKSLKRFPEALDALLKGLEKYDSNYEAAVDLEIEEDMDGCKETILECLSDEFDLTEEEAYDIVNSASQDAYSKQVVDIVVRQMKKVMEQAD